MKVLVLGTSGLDLLAEPLRERLSQVVSTPVHVTVGGYDQWRRRLLSPAPHLATPEPDLVIVVWDGEDLLGPLIDGSLESPTAVADTIRQDLLTEVTTTLEAGTSNFPSAQFIVTTMLSPTGMMLGSLAARSHSHFGEAVEDFNKGLRHWASLSRKVHVIDMTEMALLYGVRNIRDQRLWALARCRWSRQGLHLLARRVASLWQGIHGKQRKCLVVDLDNTLWGGVAGEEGLSGIALGHDGLGLIYREFQWRLRRLRAFGVLLAIASKNDEALAWEILDQHPGMVLRRSDFAAARINWADKAANLREIAEELNIGLEALVFLDDDAAERDRVRTALPEVAVPYWPGETSDLPAFVEELVWEYFNRVSLTREDLTKSAFYQAQVKRRALRARAATVDDWLRSLRMTAQVILADDANLTRLAQLTQKTNQFNVTTRRYTESQLERLTHDDNWLILASNLSDRFGDAGTVALAMVHRVSLDEWRVDGFLMSCRVIGRTLEDTLLHAVARTVKACGGTILLAEYRPTERNEIVRDLWRRMGFSRVKLNADGSSLWRRELSTEWPQPSPFIRMTLPRRTEERVSHGP